MNDLFNNREIASGIWLAIALFWVAKQRAIRAAFANVLKSFCQWKIIVTVLFMAIYIGLSLWLLYWLNLWNASLLKNAIYWFLFSGFVLHMNLITDSDYATFFRKTILDCFKVIVVIQFLINFYPLPLFVELILVPVLTFLVAASTYAGIKPEFSAAKKVFDGILVIIGFAVLVHVGRSVYLHYAGLLKPDVIRSILLPLWLTFLFLPFLYFAKLIADYEMLFTRLPYFVKREDNSLLSYVKRRIIMFCHFDLRKLSHFSRYYLTCLHSIEDRDCADQLFKEFQSGVGFNAEERE